jgi:hypothetical protein
MTAGRVPGRCTAGIMRDAVQRAQAEQCHAAVPSSPGCLVPACAMPPPATPPVSASCPSS